MRALVFAVAFMYSIKFVILPALVGEKVKWPNVVVAVTAFLWVSHSLQTSQ